MSSDEQTGASRWAGRPRAAMAVKLFSWLMPIVVSAVATYFIGHAVPRPRGLLPGAIWFVSLCVIATGILWGLDKLARRMLPLAALLQLSLVFPDRAPSRFRSALRTQTVHQLEESVAEIKRNGLPDDPTLAAETLIDLVAALSVHDRLTRGHAERVRAYTRMIGEELKLPSKDLELLTWAGLLHDVGKLFVPSEILNKPGRLTDEEFDVIKQHPGWGAQLCEPLRGWLGDWVDAVGEHHERWEGGGYPSGIAGEDISLAARIVSVADVFDVITSVRSYKTAEKAGEAREELARCAGTQFDPAIVRAFLNVSLGRLRLAMGPLSWIAQIPVIGRVPLAPAAGGAASAAATATALLATGALAQTAPAETYEQTAEAAPVVVETTVPAPPPTSAPITIDTAPPSTTEPPTTEPEIDTAPPPSTTEPVPTETTETSETTDPPPTTVETTVPEPAPTTTDPSPPPAPTTTATTTPPPAPPPATTTTTTPPPPPPPPPPATTTTTTPPPPPPPPPPATTTTTTPPPPRPVAIDDATAVDEDGSIVIDVAANDSFVVAAVVTSPPPVGLVTQLSATVFRFTPPPDWFGTTSFGYTADNGAGDTDVATVTITVNPTPDPPLAVDDTGTVDEDGTVVITALANDGDPDGDPLTITGVASADGTPTTDGTTVTYTPAPDTNGTHTITYTITDGTGLTDSATVTVTVNPTPDAPVANDDTGTVAEDGTVTVDVLANDTDADGDPLTITGVSSVDGTPTTDGTTLTYSPSPDTNGTHTITYTIDDGTGLTDTGTVTITVTPVPDAPVASDDSATMNEDTTATIGVLANDSDADGDALAITSVSSADGAATTDGTTITYTPAPDTNGTHTITYEIDDGTGLTDTATVTVTVNPTPDAPVAANDTATVDEDATVTGITALANDTDVDGDPLTITGVSSVDGTPTTDGTTITYTPAPDTNGTHTITYTITDGTGLLDTAIVTVTVNPVPDAPVAVGDGYATDEGVTLTVPAPGVLGNDSDADGDPLESTLVTPASDGNVTLQLDGSFVYVPNPLFVGTDSFTYQVDDGTGLAATATVTVTVNDVNLAPVLAPIGNQSAPESAPFTLGMSATDADVPAQALSFTATGLPAWATLTDNGDDTATITGTPGPGDVGTTSSVTVTVSDGSLTDVETFDITVTAVGTGSDLEIGVFSVGTPVAYPGNAEYVFTITNNGPDPMNRLRLTMTIPAPLSYAGEDMDGTCAWTAPTLVCTVPAGEWLTAPFPSTFSGSIFVRVPAPGPYSVDLTADSTKATYSDPVPANNKMTRNDTFGSITKLYLDKQGPGDQPSISPLPLDLETAFDLETVLHNYDTDRDAEPGLLLERSNYTPIPDDANPDEFQKWFVDLPAGLNMSSPTELRIWARRADGSAGDGALYAHLLDCDLGGGACLAPIASTSTLMPIGTGFEEFTLSFGNPGYTIGAGRSLVVRVGAQNLPTTKPMILAYAIVSYPTALYL